MYEKNTSMAIQANERVHNTMETGVEKRPQLDAIIKGARGVCPSCGKGRLFSKLLTTSDNCTECGEELSHHRADDFPAYLNIFIVGHVVVAIMMIVMTFQLLPMWELTFLTAGMAVVCSVVLMRPIKGMVIGAQWALRMHGFGGDHD